MLYLWILMWVWRELLAVNDLPQISQVKGFSPIKKKFDITFYIALPTNTLKNILYFTTHSIKCILSNPHTSAMGQDRYMKLNELSS